MKRKYAPRVVISIPMQESMVHAGALHMPCIYYITSGLILGGSFERCLALQSQLHMGIHRHRYMLYFAIKTSRKGNLGCPASRFPFTLRPCLTEKCLACVPWLTFFSLALIIPI